MKSLKIALTLAAAGALSSHAAAQEPTAPLDAPLDKATAVTVLFDDAGVVLDAELAPVVSASATDGDADEAVADEPQAGEPAPDTIDIQAAARMQLTQGKREFDTGFAEPLPRMAAAEAAALAETLDETDTGADATLAALPAAQTAPVPAAADPAAQATPAADPAAAPAEGEALATDPEAAVSPEDAEIERIADEYLEASTALPTEAPKKTKAPAQKPPRQAGTAPSPKTGAVKLSTPDSSGITAVQQALKAAGVDVAVDGRMGRETARALRSYQAKSGLPVTGQADAATKAKLGVTSL